MGCTLSSALPGLADYEEVVLSKASKARAKQAIEAGEVWRDTIRSFINTLENCGCAAALWSQDERDIPFTKAFQSVGVSITELSVISQSFFEAVEMHLSVLCEVLAHQREHHDAVKRVAKQRANFKSIKMKIDKAKTLRNSLSTVHLVVKLKKVKPPRSHQFQTEEILTGDEILDMAPQIFAGVMLDQLLKFEQSKWISLRSMQEDRVCASFQRLLLAYGELWRRFSNMYEKLKRIWHIYAKTTEEANKATSPSRRDSKTADTFHVDGIVSRTVSDRRRSVTSTSDKAFASKQQKLLLFQNPETNVAICRKRLKLLKKWVSLSSKSVQLWMQIRDSEILFTRSCYDWFSQDQDPHVAITEYSSYGLAAPNILPESVEKKAYLEKLMNWMDAIRPQSTMQESKNIANSPNLQKPFVVVKNCLQYVEKTLYNVSERERSTFEIVKRAATKSRGKAQARVEPERDRLLPTSQNRAPNQNSGNLAADNSRHKLDKTLIENRIFRRTKLAKSQTELWRGFEFCAKFMGKLYIFLGSEYRSKLASIGDKSLGSKQVISSGDKSSDFLLAEPTQVQVPRISLQMDSELSNPDPEISQKQVPKLSLSDAEISQKRQSSLRAEQALKERTDSASNRSRTPSKLLFSGIRRSHGKIFPDDFDQEGEFNGLTLQDQTAMLSQVDLIQSHVELNKQVVNSPVGSVKKSFKSKENIQFNDTAPVPNHETVLEYYKSDSPPTAIDSILMVPTILTAADTEITHSNNDTHTDSIPPNNIYIGNAIPDLNLSAVDDSSKKQPELDKAFSREPKLSPLTEELPPNNSQPVLSETNSIEPETIPVSTASSIPTGAPDAKKHRKKKKDIISSNKIDPTKPEPTAPPSSLLEGDTNKIRKHKRGHSSKKKSKGPPPPPPFNPNIQNGQAEDYLPVSNLKAPSLIVSSASSTNVTRIITAESTTNVSEVSQAPELFHTGNILHNELRAMAPRQDNPNTPPGDPTLFSRPLGRLPGLEKDQKVNTLPLLSLSRRSTKDDTNSGFRLAGSRSGSSHSLVDPAAEKKSDFFRLPKNDLQIYSQRNSAENLFSAGLPASANNRSKSIFDTDDKNPLLRKSSLRKK